ncbi:hypothetical protein CVR96_27655, partial [Salmonella enterica subsp. enterica serovar Typhimurium]|uniref:HK97 gp10 family phage protein n=1 Tax=Salmonella enterica TaxID=28901 RepID=UPI000CAE6E86
TKFEQDLLKTATETLPKESKKVMRKIGSKARTQVARHGRATVDKHTGNYHKSFKRGKPFVDDEGKTVVRVYNNAPHGHLIEYGHRIISHGEEAVSYTHM